MYVLIALLIATTCLLWGYRKGAVDVLLRLFALTCSYALAWQETPHLAGLIASGNHLPAIMAWPAAGLALFLGGLLVFSLLASWLSHIAPEHWHEKGKTAGGALGVTVGAAFAVLAVWTAGALQDAWQLRQGASISSSTVAHTPLQQLDQQLKQTSGTVMAELTSTALDGSPAAPLATQWVREPLSVGSQLQHMASKPELKLLFQEPDSYATLIHGSTTAIMQLPHFRALVTDPAVLQLMQAAGLPGQTDAERAAALAALLARFTRNFEKLRDTSEFQALLADRELKEKLQQGQLLALFTDEKMRRIASLMNADATADLPPSPVPQAAPTSADAVAAAPADDKLLYRWRDSNGRLHITEKKPADGVQVDVIQPR